MIHFFFYNSVFQDDITYCGTCGEEKPEKKCSKCKAVRYCDRDCQRLHWFAHKKTCKPCDGKSDTDSKENAKKEIDATEISQQLKNLMGK